MSKTIPDFERGKLKILTVPVRSAGQSRHLHGDLWDRQAHIEYFEDLSALSGLKFEPRPLAGCTA
ncbi:MAG: hypothetical protein OEV45_02900 [Desulfobacteraceae bacterium]|nr:hypothetical protein [Desulfobacteraceae bacterium]